MIILLLVMVFYQYFLVAVYSWYRKTEIYSSTVDFNFQILIPAHNEEKIIEDTLREIKKIDYPKEKYDVTVIVDNSSDGTINIVKSFGINFLERVDVANVGKSFALDWALREMDLDGVDAIVVIDADTKVSPNLLTTFNKYLNNGFDCVQCANLVNRLQEGPLVSLFALGNVMKNYYVYYPKFKLGSSALLLGTGMCFKSSLINEYLQETYSISEDIEFSLKLIRKGDHIAFAHETFVEALYPENLRGATTQRTRWGSGTFILIKKFFPFFLIRGIIEKRFLYIDTALTLLTWSKPIMGVTFICSLILSLFTCTYLYYIALGLAFAELCYFTLGICLLIHLRYKWKSIIWSPFLAFWFIFVTIKSLLGYDSKKWKKTER